MHVLLIAMATASVVQTIHTTFLFEGFRTWLIRFGETPGVRRWITKGIMCGYCFGHWVAAGMTLLMAPWEPSSVVTYFAAVWLAHLGPFVLAKVAR